jgi:hypothetical protein
VTRDDGRYKPDGFLLKGDQLIFREFIDVWIFFLEPFGAID